MSQDNVPNYVKKSWEEFRITGLVVLINTILHAFGWAITFDVNEDDDVIRAYPARTKFRGFDKETKDESYKRIAKYMKTNAEILAKEIL